MGEAWTGSPFVDAGPVERPTTGHASGRLRHGARLEA